MGKNIAIKVKNLSKAYQLGQIGTGTISRDLERFWKTKIRGKEDPFLKIGQTNDRTVKGESDIVWSLKDINFEIEQGDAVGIIGRNGAGKSTLLKILSRVTAPTTGNIKVKGRIASLLEVGTGFHPELTGRENIYLNGAILGMRKKEITRKFDEIVDFSGVERYIDTPVKRYSSGMYVRLAFAVAAHLDSEILIVDEVLAVGDAEFQRKCLGKMGDVSKGEGKTILFVSHNMSSLMSLCNNGIQLTNGLISGIGSIEKIMKAYLTLNKKKLEFKVRDKNLEIDISHKQSFDFLDDIKFRIELISKISFDRDLFIDFGIINQLNEFVIHYRMNSNNDSVTFKKGNNNFEFSILKPRLKPGEYSFTIYIYDRLNNVYLWVENYSTIQITVKNIHENTNYKSHVVSDVILSK
jgi:lipopolysaccharide transport system ATP-binding protein